MQLNEILVKTTKPKKRVGRGGNRGTTSGRGTKGQKSRAGRKIRPAIRDLIKRIPKKRGVKFKKPRTETIAVDFYMINDRFTAGEKISPKMLDKKGIINLPNRGM